MPVASNLNNLAGLNAVVAAKGGALIHLNEINALNNIDIIETGAGGHLNGLSALNSIDVLLGGAGGYGNELAALNSIVVLEGGVGGWLNTIDAINEWVDNSGGTLDAQILATQPGSLIALWPLTETSGTTADNLEGTAARDGTYSGVTLDQIASPQSGSNAPQWDAVNDALDIYSASLNTAYNGQECTIMIFCKVRVASVWTDGNQGRLITFRSDGDNRFIVNKTSGNDLEWFYEAGNVRDSVNLTVSPTNWFSMFITVSKSNDRLRAYYNGTQTGSDQTTLGTYVGALNSDICVVGATSFSAPLNVWDGYLSRPAIWSTELTADEILAIHNAADAL